MERLRVISVPKPGHVTVAFDVYGPRWWALSSAADKQKVTIEELLDQFIDSITGEVPERKHRDFSGGRKPRRTPAESTYSSDKKERSAQVHAERKALHEQVLNMRADKLSYPKIAAKTGLSISGVRVICVDPRNKEHAGYSG